MKMWNCLVILLLCLLANPLSGQKSLFESEIVGDENRKLNLGVNLPPKFLPGGDMDGFSLPEDTTVGTIVSCLTKQVFYFKQVYNVEILILKIGLPVKR